MLFRILKNSHFVLSHQFKFGDSGNRDMKSCNTRGNQSKDDFLNHNTNHVKKYMDYLVVAERTKERKHLMNVSFVVSERFNIHLCILCYNWSVYCVGKWQNDRLDERAAWRQSFNCTNENRIFMVSHLCTETKSVVPDSL